MRFTVKRITSIKIILTKQNTQIILSGVYNSGDKNSAIFDLVKRNMLVAQQNTQICLEACERLNGGALLWVTAQRLYILYDSLHNLLCRIRVF